MNDLMKLILVVAVLAVCACNGKRNAELTDNLPGDSIATSEIIQSVEEGKREYHGTKSPQTRVMILTDTTLLKNGDRKVTATGIGPQNEFSVTTDREGRIVETYSRASETDGQILSYTYGKGGKLIRVTDSPADISGEKKKARIIYRFRYDREGRLVELRRTVPGKWRTTAELIEASDGNHLEGDFRPVEEFWLSDLRGGRLEMYCKEMPDDSTRKAETLRRWIDFERVADFCAPQRMPDEFLGLPRAIQF